VDWFALSPLERFGYMLQDLGYIAAFFMAVWILYKFILWKCLKKHKPEPAIEKPERIKVASYNKDGSLNYWEGSGRR
jgi:hypothetical protein